MSHRPARGVARAGRGGRGALHVRAGSASAAARPASATSRSTSGLGELKTGVGDVTVAGRREGRDRTGTGAVRIGSVDGPPTVKNSNGDTEIGEVAGDVRVRAANGAIPSIGRRGVVAKTANSQVRLGEVARGAGSPRARWAPRGRRARRRRRLAGSRHEVRPACTTSWTPPSGPEPSEDAVEVHARTSLGDIMIHRSFASRTGEDEA